MLPSPAQTEEEREGERGREKGIGGREGDIGGEKGREGERRREKGDTRTRPVLQARLKALKPGGDDSEDDEGSEELVTVASMSIFTTLLFTMHSISVSSIILRMSM